MPHPQACPDDTFFSLDCITCEVELFLCLQPLFSYEFQVLGETNHINLEYLNHEEKAVVAGPKVEALEVESAKLRRNLISAMDEANFAGPRS